MIQEVILTKLINAPPKAIAELATTVVTQHGWHIKFVNPRRRKLAAFDNTTKTKNRITSRYEFDLLINWQEHNQNAIEVTVKVTEHQMKWTEYACKQRCQQILNDIENDAKEYNKADELPSETYGSARWATMEDLEHAKYLVRESDPKRLVLGPGINTDNQLIISVPAAETSMHVIVCGPTGCGKSSTIYLPNLIERTGTSAIVTEATAGDELPDLFSKTAGFRAKAGHQIYKFNPDDLTSHRINPLQYVKTYDQAAQIASLIIENTSSRYTLDAKIWENSERQLLTILIIHAVAENAGLGSIRRWLRKGPEGLRSILKNSPMLEAREEFWGFYSASSEGFRNGVISGLMQRLNLWVSPRIVALTDTTDIDLDKLHDKLFTFYLAVPAQKTHLKPLAALVFNFVLNLALEQQFKNPLSLFLDEFTNYGYVPGMAEKLTIIRHRDIPAMLGFQDYVQLLKVYGNDDASLLMGQPGTKIFFRPRDLATARKISEALGITTVVDRRITSNGSIQEREFGRPLMNSGEVMALQRGHAIAFTPLTPPVMLKTFTWQQYKDSMTYELPKFRKIEVNEELVRDCNQVATKPEWQQIYDEQINQEKFRKRNKDNNSKSDRDRASESANAEERTSPDDSWLSNELTSEQQQQPESQNQHDDPNDAMPEV